MLQTVTNVQTHISSYLAHHCRSQHVTRMLILLLLAASPASAGARRQILSALSFNVAGVPLVYAGWARRRDAIARRLRASSYDLVALQEVWLERDAEFLRRGSGLPHHARLTGEGLLGDGLLILSRFPILQTRRLTFRCRPPSLSILHRAEFLAAKGAVLARVQTPWGSLDVYDVHLAADYPSVSNREVRLAQLFELFLMIERHSSGRAFVILGDLNSQAGDPEYVLLRDLVGLRDVCMRGRRDLCGASYPDEGLRLDHVLLPAGNLPASARLAFTGNVPGAGLRYSDHAAVEAEISPGVTGLQWRGVPARQRATLESLQSALSSFQAALSARTQGRRWIPLYGFLHQARYLPEIRSLRSLHTEIAQLLAAMPLI